MEGLENFFEPEQYYYSFSDLFIQFVAGTPIKRKVWGGYWRYSEGAIYIHTKGGDVLNFKEVNDILFTVSNITMHDWEVATNENCTIKVN